MNATNTMTLKQKQLEFLNDTIEYYSTDTNRRCVDDFSDNCFYSPVTANKESISDGCAIGRHLTPELKLELDKTFNDINNDESAGVNNEEIFNQLPDNLKELNQGFLVNIQQLHDISDFWTSKGLNITGITYVENIKQIYNL